MEGWSPLNLGLATCVTTAPRNVPGIGQSDKHLSIVTGGTYDTKSLRLPAASEWYGRCPFQRSALGFWDDEKVYAWYNTDGLECGSVRTNGTGLLKLYLGTTLVATSVAHILEQTWYRLDVHWKVHATLGVIEILLDDEEVLRYPSSSTGDTRPYGVAHTATFHGVAYAKALYLDDWAINTPWIAFKFTTGTFPPAVGDTISGADGEGIAKVVHYNDVLMRGVIELEVTSGHFNTPDIIYWDLGGSGTQDSFPDESQSTWVPEGVVVFRFPTSDDVSMTWTSTITPHYQAVNSLSDTTNYLTATASGRVDGFGFEPLYADGVQLVNLLVQCRRASDTIPNISVMVGPYESWAERVGTDWQWRKFTFQIDPTSWTAFTPATFDSTLYSVKSV
jgi:hypothetical protein